MENETNFETVETENSEPAKKPWFEPFFKLFRKNPNKIKQSKKDTAFDVVNLILIGLLLLITILPLMNLFSYAFTYGSYNSKILFLPVWKGLSFFSFKYVFQDSQFWSSFLNSVIITVVVTVFSNLFMAMAAYPLSKSDFPGKSAIMIFFIILMLFSPGILPSYLLMKAFHLTGTIWSLIIVSLLNVFNILLFKTFFEGVPKELEEAAKIDGASSLQLFFTIIVPMSLPVLASCCFFTIVGSWNGYGGALIYIGDAKSAFPLAYYIYRMLSVTDTSYDTTIMLNGKNINAAAIIVSTIPILCIYPYIMNYIKSGLVIGSLKD